jgi:hypothetical protein
MLHLQMEARLVQPMKQSSEAVDAGGHDITVPKEKKKKTSSFGEQSFTIRMGGIQAQLFNDAYNTVIAVARLQVLLLHNKDESVEGEARGIHLILSAHRLVQWMLKCVLSVTIVTLRPP